MGGRRMRIAELAKRADVLTATLRFYQEQGLLVPWPHRRGLPGPDRMISPT